MQFDISDRADGMYFIQFSADGKTFPEKEFSVKKIIKK